MNTLKESDGQYMYLVVVSVLTPEVRQQKEI